MFDAQAYLRQLLDRLPRGRAWPRGLETTAAKVLLAMAEALARIDRAASGMIAELDPRTTVQLISEWETETGLPDGCLGAAETLQERRDAVVSKLTARGGQSIPFFEDLGGVLGYPVTVREYRPFRAGVNAIGDGVYDEGFRFLWEVHAPEFSTRYFRADASTAGEPLESSSNATLECVVERLKPAHTRVLFSYGG